MKATNKISENQIKGFQAIELTQTGGSVDLDLNYRDIKLTLNQLTTFNFINLPNLNQTRTQTIELRGDFGFTFTGITDVKGTYNATNKNLIIIKVTNFGGVYTYTIDINPRDVT